MTPALWPARLHHLRRDSPKPERAGAVLRRAARRPRRSRCPTAAGWCRAQPAPRGRQGRRGAVPYFALADAGRRAPRGFPKVAAQGRARRHRRCSPTGAFAVSRSRMAAPGLRPAQGNRRIERLPARLQHFVCATQRLPQMLEFYRGLGMAESDRVLERRSADARVPALGPRAPQLRRVPRARVARPTTTATRPTAGSTSATGPTAWRACASRCGGDRGGTGRATICSS